MIEQHSDKINEIVKIVYDKPHNFLFINVDSQRMFKCFDELIFNDDDDDKPKKERRRVTAFNSI